MKDCDCPYFSEEAFNSLTGPITPANNCDSPQETNNL